jgi:hypothetical protein
MEATHGLPIATVAAALHDFQIRMNMPRDYRRTAVAIGVLSALMALAQGCLIAGNSRTTSSGTKVAQSTFEQITPGSTTIGWVHATLGEPDSKTQDGDDQVWKYTYKEQTDTSGAVFLIFAGSSTNQTTNTVFIEFKDGVVIKKWRG